MSEDKKIQVGILSVAILMITLAISMPAKAGKLYVAGSYDMIDIDGLTDHSGYTITVGQHFNELVSLEGYALVSSSTEGYSGANVDINSLWGLNLNVALPINDDTYVYGIIGHAEGEAEASYGGYSETEDQSSTSYGAGIRHDLLEQYTIKAEYVQVMDDVDAFRLKFQLNFR